VARDADGTRAKLLSAARREFAAFGLAGARVDRIAAEAGSNKAQIYYYFGSKDRLFDTVFAAALDDLVRGTPLDVNDMPGFAAQLAEAYEHDPDLMRLMSWQRLERGEHRQRSERNAGPTPRAAVEATQASIAQIAQAQAQGRLSDRYPADVLLHAVLHIAALWAPASRDLAWAGKPPPAAARDRIIAQMVLDLIAT
jgi:AcrR family transcriptional regulator